METDSPPPLDLSLKHQSTRLSNGECVSHAESLNMLADMQRRFLDSTANLMPTNYTDKLQRVATGPTLPPAVSGTPSEPTEAGGASAAAVAVAAAASLREAMRTANPMPGAGYDNLYQLWMKQYVENYELYHCLQALCSYPVPPQLLLPPPPPPPPPVGSLLPQGPNGDASGTISPCPPPPTLPDLSSFLPKELAAVVNARPPICSPEHLGLSLRGNQKYSAFYQQHHGSARLAAAAAAVERPVPAPAPQPTKKVSNENFLKSKMLALGAGGSLLPDKTSPKETPATAINKTGTSPAGLPEKSGLETGFDCSCSKSFENLYNFTVHLKETNHQPRSVHNERDIPKLVRGQDMWINSETEQTREILRCMRCQQSFRTLPDLTMHMMETGHYSEIVYNDSGRCVYVNSSFGRDEKKTNGGPRKEDLKRKESYSARDPVPVHKKMIKLEDIPPPQPPSLVPAPAMVVPSLPAPTQPLAPPTPSPVPPQPQAAENDQGVEKQEATEDEEEEAPRPMSQPQQSTDEEDEEGEKGLSPTAQVTEPDSATEPSLATSVLQQIETFVERNLPKDPVKKKPSIGLLSCDKNQTEASVPVCVSTTPAPQDGPPYLAPDNPGGGPDENPLSSLQKLVETTEKTSGKVEKTEDSRRGEADGGDMEGVDSSEGDNAVAVSGSSLNSLSNLVAPSPTVIMVNPTYIYQPAFPPPPPPPSLFSPPTYPWYSAFPLVPHINNGSGSNSSSPSRTLCEPPSSSSITTSSPSVPIDAIDLSSQHPAALMTKSSPGTINATSMALAAAAAAIANNKDAMSEDGDKVNVNGGSNVVQKKAKCNYCGKPFANKGQVRLHVSKGKCPSLAASPRCKSASSLFSPTLRLPLDSHSSTEVEEKLKVYYNLAKQLSKENSE